MSGCFLQVGFLALLAPAAVAFDVEGWWAKELAWQSQTPPAFGHAMRAEFDLNASYTNLNQGSYGSTPTKVRHATEALVKLAENNPDAWFRAGLVEDGADAPFTQFLHSTRALLAKYIGAKTEDTVIVDNASHGLTAVLRSVPAFQAAATGRAGILSLDLAYYQVKLSIDYVGQTVPAPHHPLTQVDTHTTGTGFDEGVLIELVRTALANANGTVGFCSFSHIVSIPAVILPVQQLGALCRAAGALTLVDGAHVPGNLPLNVEELGVDFYVGNAHKHLFSSRGVCLLWARREHQQMVFPLVIDRGGSGSTFEQAFNYQGTSDDVTRYIALRAALAFRSWLGEERVVTYNTRLASDGCTLLATAWGTRRLRDGLQANLCNVETPCRAATASTPAGCDGVTLYRKHGFYVPIYSRPGEPNLWMRLTAQIYNTIDDFGLVRDAVNQAVGRNPTA